MGPVSRRLFLRRTSIAAAAAAAMASAPGLVGALTAVGDDAPAADGLVAGADSEAAGLTEPLVAHVRDVSTGEISLFRGTQEFVTRDPQLAARLARAAR